MQSIGERLEEARKRKGISIREAAEATKIRGDYLHKFESNQYDIKLPEIYVRGFLRTYANYLKLPGEKIINDYNGLGLNEAKQRSLSREIYGRMDLSVSNAKAEKGKESGAETPASEGAPPEAATRNPATFVPQGGGGAISIDKKLLIKFGAIAAAVILVIAVGLWAIFGLMGRSSPKSTASPGEIWVKPTEGEASFSLVAKGTVTVTVTGVRDGNTLYKGTIPLGDTRAIPAAAMPASQRRPPKISNSISAALPTRWPPEARLRSTLPPKSNSQTRAVSAGFSFRDHAFKRRVPCFVGSELARAPKSDPRAPPSRQSPFASQTDLKTRFKTS